MPDGQRFIYRPAFYSDGAPVVDVHGNGYYKPQKIHLSHDTNEKNLCASFRQRKTHTNFSKGGVYIKKVELLLSGVEIQKLKGIVGNKINKIKMNLAGDPAKRKVVISTWVFCFA